MNSNIIYKVLFFLFFLALFGDIELNAANLIEEYGINKGDAINNGYVFIEGKYIESPYIVSRRGLELYINERIIKNAARHPGLKPLNQAEDPNALPEEQQQKLKRRMDATKEIYESYLKKDYGYLFFNNGAQIKLSPYTIAYDIPDVISLLSSDKTKDKKQEGLLTYNWHLFTDISSFIDNFTVTEQLQLKITQQSSELLKTDEYGESAAEVVNSGYVFMDGKYLDAPYIVRRIGLGVFINGKLIDRPIEIPVIPSGDENPDMPTEITDESSIYDEVVNNYISEKMAYLHKNKPEEEIFTMEQTLTNLPFVVSARKDPEWPDTLYLATTEGITVPMSLKSFWRRLPSSDKNSVIERINKQKNNYVQGLSKGSGFVLSENKGTKVSLSRSFISEKLPKIFDEIESNKTTNQKIQDINKLNHNLPEDVIKDMVNNYSYSQQLRNRLDSIRSDL